VLGSGAMAAVYRAHDVQLDLDVALKILPAHLAGDRHFIARFRREGRVLAHLHHPNILRFYVNGEDEAANLYYLVLELSPRARVFGTVRDEDGKLIPGSYIDFRPTVVHGESVAYRSQDGRYAMQAYAGWYQLYAATAPGYVADIKYRGMDPGEIVAGSNTQIDFVLKRVPPRQVRSAALRLSPGSLPVAFDGLTGTTEPGWQTFGPFGDFELSPGPGGVLQLCACSPMQRGIVDLGIISAPLDRFEIPDVFADRTVYLTATVGHVYAVASRQCQEGSGVFFRVVAIDEDQQGITIEYVVRGTPASEVYQDR